MALDQHRRSDFLSRGAWQVADAACRGGNRSADIGRGEVETHQLLRIDPDAQGTFGTIQLGLADPVETLDFVHHVARQVVAERGVVVLAVMGGEGCQQQETGGNLFHLQTLLGHGGGQA